MVVIRPLWASFALMAVLFAASRSIHAEDSKTRQSALESAAKVDAALVRALPSETRLPAVIDDEKFLRRLTLDLTGKLPDPEALRQFIADKSADKRVRIVNELLKSEAYAVNWGRYWRDT